MPRIALLLGHIAYIGVLADSTRHWHPWAGHVYQQARQRGCDHPHAIRILGRADPCGSRGNEHALKRE